MLQFNVPQFIDNEDRIIGPFTLKQFGFIFAAGLIIVAIFRAAGTSFIFWVLSFPLALAALGISFGKFNGRAVYNALPVFINFLKSDKLYIFEQKKATAAEIGLKPLRKIDVSTQTAGPQTEEPVQSRLKRVSMLLDQKNEEEKDLTKQTNAK